MISEFFLNIIFNIAYDAMSLLPVIDWVIPTSWVGFVQDAMSVVGYLLPIGTIKSIIVLIIAMIGFRVGVSVIKTIWALLPIF